ncbi:hypothetical protein [Floccifex sp.]|uniref:hypothetical protein n=1 Tax=Floccifex sp. TaxID=2815810 RepID=UPI003F079A5B
MKGKSPNHVLTYTKGNLTWDSSTVVKENGIAYLNLFHSVYENAVSNNSEKITAPGVHNESIVRLYNQVNGPIQYKAFLYQIQDQEQMNVHSNLESNQVVNVLEGTIEGKKYRDLDISCLWPYEVSDQQDEIDSMMGDFASIDKPTNVEVGLYVVIEDDNQYISTDTSLQTHTNQYFVLLAISTLIILILFRKKNK